MLHNLLVCELQPQESIFDKRIEPYRRPNPERRVYTPDSFIRIGGARLYPGGSPI